MRFLFYFVVFLVSVGIFDVWGILISALIIFGYSMFRRSRISVDASEPFFQPSKSASLEDARFFELFGYLCKLDGVVSEGEIIGVEAVFEDLEIVGEERTAAIASFNVGKQTDYDLDAALEKVSQLNMRQTTAVQLIHFMNVVLITANPGGLTREQNDALYRIGYAFGLLPELIQETLFAYQPHSDGQQEAYGEEDTVAPSMNELDRAYATLGLEENATAKEVSRTYRKLRSRYHPDKLSRNASRTERRAAERHFTAIQNAWETVRTHHGM